MVNGKAKIQINENLTLVAEPTWRDEKLDRGTAVQPRATKYAPAFSPGTPPRSWMLGIVRGAEEERRRRQQEAHEKQQDTPTFRGESCKGK
jgi:hypothetical protein